MARPGPTSRGQLMLMVLMSALLAPCLAQQGIPFTYLSYRATGSGPTDASQMAGALQQVANSTFATVLSGSLQVLVNNYTSCSPAAEVPAAASMQPPQAPPPPGSVVVSIGRKLLQAAAAPPQPQLIATLNASQCWDLNFTLYLASDTGTNPTTVPALGYTTMNALDVMSADQGLQVTWVALQIQLVSSSAYFHLQEANTSFENATSIVLQLSGPGAADFTVAQQTLLLSYLQQTTWQTTNALFSRITTTQQAGTTVNVTLVTMFRQNATSVNYAQAVTAVAQNGSLAAGLTQSGLNISSAAVLSVAVPSDETLLQQAQALAGTTSNSSAAGATAPRPKGSSFPAGAIAGIAVGAAVAIAAAGLAAWYVVKRRRISRADSEPDPKMEVEPRSPKLTNGFPTNGSYGHGPDTNGSANGHGPANGHSPVHTNGDVFMPRALSQQDSLASKAISGAQVSICRRPDGSEWLLGQGSYGKVYKGQRLGAMVTDVAIKRLQFTDAYQTQQFIREVHLHKAIKSNQHLVQFHGACLDQTPPMLIMELMAGGNLRHALSDDTLSPNLKWYRHGRKLAMDIAKGLDWLHSQKIIHSDLKPQNVLLTADHSEAKIGDVGLSKILQSAYTGTASNNVGTLTYAAPEAILGEKCDTKMDIWSFGVVLWEIVTHDHPRRGQLRQLRTPEECPPCIADLIDHCHTRHSKKRPSAAEVLMMIENSPPSPLLATPQADLEGDQIDDDWSGSETGRGDGDNDAASSVLSSQPGQLSLRVDKGTLGDGFGPESYGDADMADHPSAVRSILTRSSAEMVEWARAENAYADRHGPQEELLTTEDLAGLNQLDDDNPSKKNLSRLSTESITGLPFMQNRGVVLETPSPQPAPAVPGQPEHSSQRNSEDSNEPPLHPFLEHRNRSHSHRQNSHGSRKSSRSRVNSFNAGERQEIGDSVRFDKPNGGIENAFGRRKDPENVFAVFRTTARPSAAAAEDASDADPLSEPEAAPMQRQSSRLPSALSASDRRDRELDDLAEDLDGDMPGTGPPGLLQTDPMGGWGSDRNSTSRLLSTRGQGRLLSTSNMLSTDQSGLYSTGIYSTGAMSTSDVEAPMLRAGKHRSDYQ